MISPKVVNHRFRSHLEWTSRQKITILAIEMILGLDVRNN